MKNKDLLKRLDMLGFPLFKAEESIDVNFTLADMVKSKDLRLWEGFPVILANTAEKGLFNYAMVKHHLKNRLDRAYLNLLLLMSLALYRFLNLKFTWTTKLYKILITRKRDELNRILASLKKNKDFRIANFTISSQRLKSTFNNYVTQTYPRLNDLVSMREELNLEYLLSQIFSAKQKELFLKKLKGERFTKTEREYFSRVVKKKILALADPELHRLSRRLLE